MMNKQLFRKTSIDRVLSSEQLSEHISVSNPWVWMFFVDIPVLLVSVCVWGVTGHLDTTVSAVAVSRDGTTMVYVKEANIASVQEGMSVTVGENECIITDIIEELVVVDSVFNKYALRVGALQKGESDGRLNVE